MHQLIINCSREDDNENSSLNDCLNVSKTLNHFYEEIYRRDPEKLSNTALFSAVMMGKYISNQHIKSLNKYVSVTSFDKTRMPFLKELSKRFPEEDFAIVIKNNQKATIADHYFLMKNGSLIERETGVRMNKVFKYLNPSSANFNDTKEGVIDFSLSLIFMNPDVEKLRIFDYWNHRILKAFLMGENDVFQEATDSGAPLQIIEHFNTLKSISLKKIMPSTGFTIDRCLKEAVKAEIRSMIMKYEMGEDNIKTRTRNSL